MTKLVAWNFVVQVCILLLVIAWFLGSVIPLNVLIIFRASVHGVTLSSSTSHILVPVEEASV